MGLPNSASSSADTIKTLFHGFGHNLVDENCNNMIKDHDGDNKGCKHCGERRLYIPIARTMISELYSNKELALDVAKNQTALSHGRPRVVPRAAFGSQAGKTALDKN